MNDKLPPVNLPAIPPDAIAQMIGNQAQEIALKEKELKLREQQDNHNFEYANAALSAQIEDNKSHRDYLKSKRRNYFYFIGAIVIIISGVIVVAMCLNKDQVALEIIKATLFFLTGGFGGYALGKGRKNNEAPPPSQQT